MEYIAICNVVKQSSTGSFERDALDQTVIDCEKSLLQSVFLLENIIDNIRSISKFKTSEHCSLNITSSSLRILIRLLVLDYQISDMVYVVHFLEAVQASLVLSNTETPPFMRNKLVDLIAKRIIIRISPAR